MNRVFVLFHVYVYRLVFLCILHCIRLNVYVWRHLEFIVDCLYRYYILKIYYTQSYRWAMSILLISYSMASPNTDDATFRNFVTKATAPTTTVSKDMRLCTAVARLRASGWYYEGANAQAMATDALTRMPAGRFFVRDSRHLERLFTMDVQTGRIGESRPISVRFTYVDGMFGLDMVPRHTDAYRIPKFRCPIELVEYYVRMSRMDVARQMSVYPTWVDQRGKFFSWMNLRQPMVKVTAEEFPSLKHMARLVINRHNQLITMASASQPNELIEYLLQYPYSLWLNYVLHHLRYISTIITIIFVCYVCSLLYSQGNAPTIN